MGRFIGRAEELAFLEESYDSMKTKAIAILGRRRIGKTSLIEEFIRDKKNLYVQFLDAHPSINLRRLETYMKTKIKKEFEFKDSIDFFIALADVIRGERYVIVFDEFPFMSSKDDAFTSMLQNFIDHDIGESIVIISGSSISMMDQEIRDYSRPLFGRVHRYLLGPMKIADCAKFHPKMSEEDQMKMYLTFGGIPMYYDMDETTTYRKFIEKYVLKENSRLRLEGETMLRVELPHSEKCNQILDAIVNRNGTIPQIVNETGIDRMVVKGHIGRMMDLGMVKKEHVVAGSKVKPDRYIIKDRMLAFHHYVIRRNLVQDPSANCNYDSIKGPINTFLGKMFEQQCMEYVLEHYAVKEIGKWYGKIPLKDKNGKMVMDENGKVRTEETDIDLVAYIQKDENVIELYGECKFSSEPIGFPEYDKLHRRMSKAKVGANSRMIFFSRNGFYEKFEEYAKENGIILVDLDNMVG